MYHTMCHAECEFNKFIMILFGDMIYDHKVWKDRSVPHLEEFSIN